MKLQAKKINYKKLALAISLCVLILWGLLGTGTSLAWFADTSPELNNIFHFASFDLELSHRLTDGSWEPVDGETRVFDDRALYEPGYVQVVYLKVENKGSVPFEFFTAVNVNDCVEAVNLFGQRFLLQDYLKFGITTAESEAAMKASIPNREKAEEIAHMPLHNYAAETAVLEPGGTSYIALIVRMPREVGNVANYRGTTVPRVELGITVRADQLTD